MNSINKSPEPEKPKLWSVGIWGLGNVGMAATRELTNIPEIGKLYLFSSDRDKLNICKDSCGKDRHIDFMGRQIGQLNEELANIDIMLITANKSPYRTARLTRDDEFRYNYDIIKRAAYELSGFAGSTIVVTNPVDINAYVLSSFSDISPQHITGLNHIDLARWRNIMYDVFASHIDQEHLGKIKVVTIGPHNDEMVSLFVDYEGLPQSEIAFLTRENLKMLRQAVKQYANRQIETGKSQGKFTEDLTADSLKEVVDAIIHPGRVVCQSTYMEPGELGLEGVLPGIFFGYPVVFDEMGRAIAQPQIIDDMADLNLITRAYHNLEGLVLGLEKGGYIQKRVVNKPLEEIPEETQVEAKMRSSHIRLSPDYISLEGKITACANDTLYTWENPRNPNQVEKRQLPYRIESLEQYYENGEKYLLLGREGGISVADLRGKHVSFLESEGSKSIRRLAQTEFEGQNYVFGASLDTVYIYEPGKSDRPIEVITGIEGHVNNLSVSGEWLLISAGKLYLHNIRNPQLSEEISLDSISHREVADAKLVGDNLFIGVGSTLVKLAMGRPIYGAESCRPDAHNITGIAYTPYLGGTIFLGDTDPPIHRIDGQSLEIYQEALMKPGRGVGTTNNPYIKGSCNGTDKIVYVEQDGMDYLLAADKNIHTLPQNPGVTVWNLMAPDLPRFLPIDSIHNLRGLVVVNPGGTK